MKLLNRTSLYSLSVYLIVFCLGGVLFLYLFQRIIDADLNLKLHERQHYVIAQMAESDSLVSYQRYSANTLSFERVAGPISDEEVISDTVLFDHVEQKEVRYRQLAFGVTSHGQSYRVRIRRALVEQSYLVEGAIVLVIVLFIGLVALLTFLNNQLSRQLWRPFYAILDRINAYRLERGEVLQFARTNTTEFNELASSIEKMSAIINHEFNSQKEFIENASHEMQTPLAVIRNKLEELMQLPELTEVQMQSISRASLAANRLSKLNEALLILSRIENRQFHVVERVSIRSLLNSLMNGFEELIQMKGIRINYRSVDEVVIDMNPYLAEILLENLVVNAIKHNVQGGMIEIDLELKRLLISNSGELPQGDPTHFFQRFEKANKKSTSLGLGLPIVKAICDTYQFPIRYTYENGYHNIEIEFTR